MNESKRILVNWAMPPPPWELGENESLDIAYYKVMRALHEKGYQIVKASELECLRTMIGNVSE